MINNNYHTVLLRIIYIINIEIVIIHRFLDWIDSRSDQFFKIKNIEEIYQPLSLFSVNSSLTFL